MYDGGGRRRRGRGGVRRDGAILEALLHLMVAAEHERERFSFFYFFLWEKATL